MLASCWLHGGWRGHLCKFATPAGKGGSVFDFDRLYPDCAHPLVYERRYMGFRELCVACHGQVRAAAAARMHGAGRPGTFPPGCHLMAWGLVCRVGRLGSVFVLCQVSMYCDAKIQCLQVMFGALVSKRWVICHGVLRCIQRRTLRQLCLRNQSKLSGVSSGRYIQALTPLFSKQPLCSTQQSLSGTPSKAP